MSITLLQKTEARRTLDREWAPYLSSGEKAVMSFLFTVTVEWGKLADRVKREHFVNGLPPAGGTGLSPRSVQTHLATLERDGAIWRKRTPYGHVMGIHLDWDPGESRVPIRVFDEAKGMLRTPKRLRESGKICQSRVAKFATPYREEHTLQEHTYHSPSPVGSEGSPPTGISLSATDAIQAQVDRTVAIGAARKEKDREKLASKYSSETVERIYWAAFRATFPGAVVAAWTKQAKGQVRLFLRDPKAPKERYHPVEILEWCVTNWRLIMGARFNWMEQGTPELPAIGFMLQFKDRFYDAYAERERLRIDLTVSGTERYARRLRHQGLSEEEAKEQAEARSGVAKEREALAQQRQQLNDMMRRVEDRNRSTSPDRFLRDPKRPLARSSGLVRPKGGSDE